MDEMIIKGNLRPKASMQTAVGGCNRDNTRTACINAWEGLRVQVCVCV